MTSLLTAFIHLALFCSTGTGQWWFINHAVGPSAGIIALDTEGTEGTAYVTNRNSSVSNFSKLTDIGVTGPGTHTLTFPEWYSFQWKSTALHVGFFLAVFVAVAIARKALR